MKVDVYFKQLKYQKVVQKKAYEMLDFLGESEEIYKGSIPQERLLSIYSGQASLMFFFFVYRRRGWLFGFAVGSKRPNGVRSGGSLPLQRHQESAGEFR